MPTEFKLREASALAAEVVLDEEKGILRGVKVLGLESKAKLGSKTIVGKRYTAQAIKSAIPLLENAKVFFDHAEEDEHGNDKPRKFGDRFGRLKEITQNSAGEAYGDLHYNPHHPRANAFVHFAKHDPAGLGLSIVGAGNGRVENGVKIVEQITQIASVDLVDGPATAFGLYEQEGYKPVSDPTADAAAHAKAAAAHATAAQAAVAGAGTPPGQEGGAMNGEVQSTAPGGADGGGDQWRTKLAELAHTAVSDASLGPADVLKKLKGICNLIEEEEGAGIPADDAAEAGPEKMAEQLRTFSHPAVKWASGKIDGILLKERTDSLREQAKAGGVPENAITEKFVDTLLKEQSADGIASLIADRAAVATPAAPAPRTLPRDPPGNKTEPFDAAKLADKLFTTLHADD